MASSAQQKGGRALARMLERQLSQFAAESRGISSGTSSSTSLGGSSAGAAAQQHQQEQVRSVATQAAVAVKTTSSNAASLLKVVVPAVATDLYGAVSMVTPEDKVQPGVYKNQDGHRFDDGRYKAFMEEVGAFIPKQRQFTDAVRTFAYGTDASFYRLNPKLVVKVHDEAEMRRILPIAERLQVPVTFRAAGTSLSGQAITDSVLLKISHTGKNFRNFTVHVSAGRPGYGAGQRAAGTAACPFECRCTEK